MDVDRTREHCLIISVDVVAGECDELDDAEVGATKKEFGVPTVLEVHDDGAIYDIPHHVHLSFWHVAPAKPGSEERARHVPGAPPIGDSPYTELILGGKAGRQ